MRCVGLLLLLTVLLVPGSAAQQRLAAEGIARLTDWPASSETARAELDEQAFEVLPFLDTLTLGYRYIAAERGPRLEAALEWTPGRRGIYDGKEVDYKRLPADVEMTALVLGAQVHVGGRPVANAVIAIDSLALAASPATYTVTVDTLAWETVFESASAAEARAYFEAGFELRNLEIVSVAFASYEDEVAERERPRRHRRATRTTVYEPGFGADIYIGGVIGGGSRPRPPRDGRRRDMGRDAVEQDHADRSPTRTGSGREEGAAGSGARGDRTTTRTSAEDGGDVAQESGKGTSEGGERATSRREGRKASPAKRDDSDDDDEDDDDNELLPTAIAVAAAVGVVAYAGGTLGYYGNLAKAPIGLTSGFVRPNGGALLHVAVNEAFLRSDPGSTPRHLVAKLTGFYNAFDAPVQPAVGIGVLARDPGENVDVRLSLSFGAVATLGPVVLMGSYDVAQGGAEVGLAINFRYKRPGGDQVAARE